MPLADGLVCRRLLHSLGRRYELPTATNKRSGSGHWTRGYCLYSRYDPEKPLVVKLSSAVPPKAYPLGLLIAGCVLLSVAMALCVLAATKRGAEACFEKVNVAQPAFPATTAQPPAGHVPCMRQGRVLGGTVALAA